MLEQLLGLLFFKMGAISPERWGPDPNSAIERRLGTLPTALRADPRIGRASFLSFFFKVSISTVFLCN